MFAIVKIGGKQSKCEVGKVFEAEKVDCAVGSDFDIKDVVLVCDSENKLHFKGATVVCQVVEHKKAKKVIAFRRQIRTSSFTKKKGHKQSLTALIVKEIKFN